MRIELEVFPNVFLSVSLARLKGTFGEFREQVSQIPDIAVIDRRMVLSALQLAAAASAALGASERGELLTRCFGTELLYRLSGSNNVPWALGQRWSHPIP